MSKPELVLSNTTSFFFGGVPALFKNAKKYGFKYLEIIPYRWTRPQEVLDLQKKFDIQIAGIHLAQWWGKTLLEELPHRRGILEKIFLPLWAFYLGDSAKNPGLALAEKLPSPNPYVLLHTNVVADMGWEKFAELSKKFHLVIENIPYHPDHPRFYWDPVAIQKEMQNRNLPVGLVFDPAHFNENLDKLPQITLLDTYQQISPEVIHVSYNSSGIHTLPNKKEQQELIQMLKIHPPKYITLETNPWVSIKKGKKLLEEIIEEALVV